MFAGLGEKPIAQSVQSELLVEPGRYIGGEGQRAWWCRVSRVGGPCRRGRGRGGRRRECGRA